MNPKLLYININNEHVQSNEELEVLEHDLDSYFFFYLGERISKACNVENENALITDFNTPDTEEDYKQIIAQWNEIKTILFCEECKGNFEFTLPNGYIHWLKFHPQYVSVYDRNFSHGEPAVITIDLEELYEDSIEDLQRKILRKLQRDDLCLEIDEIVFNDDAVTRKSPIVRTIKEKYEGIGFKSYKKWGDGNGGNPKPPQVCGKCGKSPCECSSTPLLNKDYFPIEGVILFKTSCADVQREYLELDDNLILYKPKDGITFIQDRKEKFFSIVCISEEQAYPKLWENLLGLKWNMSHEICKSILVKNGHKYKSNEMPLGCAWTYSLFVLSIDEKCIFNLGYLHNKLNYIRVFLNKCPRCNSDNLMLLDHFDSSSIKMKCKECEILLLDSIVVECPECCSENIKDDGSNYLQYTCNDCGHNWGHDDTIECPECGSNDVENDGTDNMQYECKVCGHMWGDDNVRENDKGEEYNGDIDNAGNKMSEYLKVSDFTVGKSTKSEVKKKGGKLVADFGDSQEYVMPNGISIRFYNNSQIIDSIVFTEETSKNIPQFYKNLGYYWEMIPGEIIELFETLGFDVDDDEYSIYALKKCAKYDTTIRLTFCYDNWTEIFLFEISATQNN